MVDEVLLGKVATIERCIARAREEYLAAGESFSTDFTRQDAAILNVQRACEAALDMGYYVVKRDKLGLPQSARQVFEILLQSKVINAELAAALKKMISFRNIVVHDYQTLILPVAIDVITLHLDELLQYSAVLLQKGV